MKNEKYKFIFCYDDIDHYYNMVKQINDHWQLCGGHVSKLNHSYYGNNDIIKLFYLTCCLPFDFIIADVDDNDVLDKL